MTPAQLKERLTALLAAQLGTYQDKNGTARGAAISVGNPPGLKATGLEVIIDSTPELATVQLHTSPAIVTDRRVRLIPHNTLTTDGRGDPNLPLAVEAAARRILTALNTTSVTHVPANERLGILAQTIITVRS